MLEKDLSQTSLPHHLYLLVSQTQRQHLQLVPVSHNNSDMTNLNSEHLELIGQYTNKLQGPSILNNDSIQHNIINNFLTLTEDQLLKEIEAIANMKANPPVHRMQFSSVTQHHNFPNKSIYNIYFHHRNIMLWQV